MKIKSPHLILLSLLTSLAFAGETLKSPTEKPIKVLYVTHEPGQYHDYTGQRKVFEALATEEKWDYTVLSSSYDGLVEELAQKHDFAKGYDVVVYNFCLAHSANLKTVSNIIKQTEELKVNALLIHGAIHSFWPTFSKKHSKKNSKTLVKVGCCDGHAEQVLVDEWQSKNAEKAFPVWGDFCGMASDKHSAKLPVTIDKLIEHDSVTAIPKTYKTGKTELYLNAYKTPNTIEILQGKIPSKKQSAIILWEKPHLDAIIMGFTLGHFTEEWETPEFRAILTDTIEYLAK